ncbi:hypothetical protein [Egbenema bharatensis]|uniref:hypothetical protein n=1 Tax=Egbenema bharatensis TaxID=3463334 RepID=UPI003A83F7CE
MTQVINDNLQIIGDTYLKAENFVSLHYGNRGKLGQTPNFNPDNNNNGLWLEASTDGSESGGIFCNGNTIVLWSPGDNDTLRVYDEDNFGSSNLVPRFVINNVGNVGIGTATPQAKLDVNGDIKVKDWTLSVPDYVFESDYELRNLNNLRNYIDRYKHLPEVPSAQAIHEEGVNLGEFCMSLLKKIEELSLYVLQQHDIIQAQDKRLAKLEQSTDP